MERHVKICFVCHGNICRSCAAKFIMADKIKKLGLEKNFEIDSAATSTEELGNPVYPPMADVLKNHGIAYTPHQARQMTDEDYKKADVIYVMDSNNMHNILLMTNGDSDGKIEYLLKDQEIEDPWYTNRYEKVFNLISMGCDRVIEHFCNN